MIKIARVAEPQALKDLEPGWTKALTDEFDKAPQDYLDGKKKLAVKEHVYGHDAVRLALREMQHSKCCYCEVHMDEYTPRHVEHWRPKGGVRATKSSSEMKPGYYWLAYAWNNLFLACNVCNSLNKGTQFPLRDEGQRGRSHADVTHEDPLLLRPDDDDPDNHITWRNDQPRGLTEKGWATIEVCGLIRDNDTRRTAAFKKLELAHKRLWQVYDIAKTQDLAQELREELRAAKRDDSPFTAMAKAYLAKLTFPAGYEP